MHQARYLTHPNGAKALAEVVLVTADAEETAYRYEKLTGQKASKAADRFTIDLPLVTRLIFMNPEAIGAFLPGSLFSPAPSIVAIGFQVEDLHRTKDLLKRGGFDVVQSDDRLIVPAEEALGVAHYFLPLSRSP